MGPVLRQFVVAGVLGLAGLVLSLGVIGTATAQGGTGGILNPLHALIVNTASQPVPVSLTGPVSVAPIAVPFQQILSPSGPNRTYTVPADKRAVIKFVTGHCTFPTTLPNDGVLLFIDDPADVGMAVSLASNTPSRTITIHIDVEPELRNQVFFTQQVLITAPPASSIYLFASLSPVACSGFISGDLVPAE